MIPNRPKFYHYVCSHNGVSQTFFPADRVVHHVMSYGVCIFVGLL